MAQIRSPAVAGTFYPGDAETLAKDLRGYLAEVAPSAEPVPKAIIAPHAGFIYSGPIAASVYARLAPARGRITRVVLIGPSHRVAFRGIAGSLAEAFATPLGNIPLDREAMGRALQVPGTGLLDAAHAQEHSLEVHLPFLQMVLGSFALVPLVAGEADPDQVAAVLEAVWGGPETLIVVSTDLSHYLDYAAAQAIDARTCRAIETLDATPMAHDQACGRVPVSGLLLAARRHGLAVQRVDLRNSGDTAGPRDRVVGYGAWAFTEALLSDEEATLRRHAAFILDLAKTNIKHRLETGSPAPMPTMGPAILAEPGAVFVTLKKQGQLRGCIGSPTAWRPLAADIADNAIKAAFHDPRFPPLTAPELAGLELSVSVLTAPRPMTIASEADLLAQLRPGIDGLIIEDGQQRALFLPSVWEALPDPRQFLTQLKLKAGMAANAWSPQFKAQRFTAVELK
jgi:hypothetical protein